MKSLLTFILASTLVSTSASLSSKPPHTNFTDSIDWSHTKDWKLYHIRSKDAFTYRVDTLKNFKCITLQQDSVSTFLMNIKELPKGKDPVWMGTYVASCQLATGNRIKIDISQYGGFFYVEKEDQYYELAEENRTAWLSYLTEKWVQMETAK